MPEVLQVRTLGTEKKKELGALIITFSVVCKRNLRSYLQAFTV